MAMNLQGSEEVPVVIISGASEPVKSSSSSATNSFNLVASAVGDVPSLLFDSKEERSKLQSSSMEEFARSKAHTPVDGLAKGIAALGGSLVKGLTGVVTEPIRGASENGAEGFFSGIGKGLLGVVFKPIGGVLEFGGKVGEGFVNTPETLAGLVRRDDTTIFGVPLLEGFEKCRESGRRHLFSRVMEVLSDHQKMKSTEGLFVYGTAPKLVKEIALAYDQGLDPDLSTIDPFISVGLLIRWLERLPEAVIPESFHLPLNALLSPHKRFERSSPVLLRMHDLLRQLPPVNKSVLTELCVAIRRYLYYSNSGSVVLDHISILVGKNLLRTGIPLDLQQLDANEDTSDQSPSDSAPVKKPDFPSPEAKKFTLHITRTILQFYCPAHLTYQLSKSEVVGL
jgi:hypothetical protein